MEGSCERGQDPLHWTVEPYMMIMSEPTHDNKQKEHTPCPRIEIKISGPARNGTRATGLEANGLYRPRHGDGSPSAH